VEAAMVDPGRTPSGQDDTDEACMSRLASGDPEALAVLHARHASWLFGKAARSLDRETAEDVVQDVFVAIWRSAARFDPSRGSFRGWAARILQGRIANALRQRGRRQRGTLAAEEISLADLPDPDPPPDDAAWRAFRRSTVRDAVAVLPPHQRQALSLAFFEDLTHEQVATFLGLPLGTAKTRIRAGLGALRASLAPLGISLLVVAGLGVGWLTRERGLQQALDRRDRALQLATASDVAPLRLVAAPDIPSDAHGNYRGRPGTDLAILTCSHLPPAPEHRIYRAWIRLEDRWRPLGTITPDGNGHALLIAESPGLGRSPEELRLTLESTDRGMTPSGPTILVWPGR
jgi:RNA polymerase sigma-70 factor (ECF subfamily)